VKQRKSLELWFEFASTYSYLSVMRIEKVAEAVQLEVVWRPFLLGPIFNQNSCASCHNNPVGGSGTITVTRFGFFDGESGTFDPLANLGGSVLQSQAISIACQETVPALANVVTVHTTPSALGFGLVEAIADADIAANAILEELQRHAETLGRS